MIFGATLCASDSVAALSMIKADKYPKLFSIVFGEGFYTKLLNHRNDK
jgi:sodium/hydrogen exchanger-like protein 6/7/sodium/hydrogen exchanger 8